MNDYDDALQEHEVWAAWLHDMEGNVLDALYGVDFGQGNGPWDSPYRRVVEAELALEAMP